MQPPGRPPSGPSCPGLACWVPTRTPALVTGCNRPRIQWAAPRLWLMTAEVRGDTPPKVSQCPRLLWFPSQLWGRRGLRPPNLGQLSDPTRCALHPLTHPESKFKAWVGACSRPRTQVAWLRLGAIAWCPLLLSPAVLTNPTHRPGCGSQKHSWGPPGREGGRLYSQTPSPAHSPPELHPTPHQWPAPALLRALQWGFLAIYPVFTPGGRLKSGCRPCLAHSLQALSA